MKLSVIVPIYNSQQYLDECIKSILNQTLGDFELILINDGSTDNSLDMCRDWANTDARIKLIDQKNGGVSSARNAGLDVSCGEYIAFIDSDDYISDTMFEKLYAIAKRNDADISICKRLIPGKIQNYGHEYPVDNKFSFSNAPANWKKLFYQGDIETFVTNKIFKRSFVTAKNVKFLPYPLFEDRVFLQQLYFGDPTMICIDEGLYFYRPVADSAVRKYFPQRFDIIKSSFRYDMDLNFKFDQGRFTDVIHTRLAESIINCIIQEKISSYKQQTKVFDKIRNSTEFSLISVKIEDMQIQPKRKQLINMLRLRQYVGLYLQLKCLNCCDIFKVQIKKVLGV